MYYNGQYYETSNAIVKLIEELQQHEKEKAAIKAYIQKKGK